MRGTRSPALFRTNLVFLILLVVLPALALVLYAYVQQRRVAMNSVHMRATALSELAASHAEGYIKSTRQLLATVAQADFLVLATNPAVAGNDFHNLRILLPDYLDFGMLETNGSLFCSADSSNPPINLGASSFFRRVLQTTNFATGDFTIERPGVEPALGLGYPVLTNDTVVRVLYACLKLSSLSKSLTGITLPRQSEILVLDRNGTVLSGFPQTNLVGHSLEAGPSIQRILAGKETVFQMPGLTSVPELHAVTRISENVAPSVFVSVDIPLSVSFATANSTLLHNIAILAVVGTLVTLIVSFYAGRFFFRPLNSLAVAAESLAAGNLNARAGDVEGPKELVELAHAFDDMADRLKTRQEEISNLNKHLEQRVAEQTSRLESTNKELEAFNYSVSHDLRAPLRHILGFSELLKEEQSVALGEVGRRYLDMIENRARETSKLVEDLLSFSKTGRDDLRIDRVPLDEMVDEIIASLKNDYKGRQVEWKIAPLPEVSADPALLRMALVNLLSNALKYSRTRERAEVRVASRSTETEDTIFVRDNGVGFDMKHAGKLFGIFQRMHDRKQFEGNGIGLANVHRIIVRHGGKVWAEAEPEHGATFYFSLPKKPGATPATGL